MVEDVKSTMDNFLQVSLFWISTSCNVASDALAKHAQAIEGPLTWLELSPPCLQNILYIDFHYIKIIYPPELEKKINFFFYKIPPPN